MKLDNAKRAGYIKLFYMVFPLLVLSGVAFIYLFYDVKNLSYLGIAFCILVLFFGVLALFRFNYIVFYAGPDKIQIRFKALTPFNNPNNSVQIKAENFHKYEIVKSKFFYRKILILYQVTPSGLAQYPGIGITALSKSEILSMTKAFDLILAINNKEKK